MDLKNKDLNCLNENLDNLPDFEYELSERLDRKFNKRFERGYDFLVIGAALEKIDDMAAIHGYEVIHLDLDNWNLLSGEYVKIKSDGEFFYNERHTHWTDLLVNNPDKKYLVVFNVDKADIRLINALKSIIERHVVDDCIYDNMLVCVLCTDPNRDLTHTTIYDLVKPAVRME